MSQKVDQALTNAIVTGGLGIDIVYENGWYSVWGGSSYTNYSGSYEPNADREYCEIRNFPALRDTYTLSDSDEETGLFQVILRYPANKGSTSIKTKAEEVMALFSPNTPITYSGQSVYTVSKNRDGGRPEGAFYQIIVRINYRAFVPR